MLTMSDYAWLLPGLDAAFPQEFIYLARLLGQDQFEMDTQGNGKCDRRVIYLMNDTVESWIVLQNCSYTGEYDPDYEGELQPRITRDDNGYILILTQGESVLTFFFTGIEMQVHLYDYGDVGHFWVKGYEHLRMLEYQIAIISDKLEYLGEAYVSEEEMRIASLRDFPPLGSVCYPAAPTRYVVGKDDPWHVSEAAADVMMSLAKEADDMLFWHAVRLYKVLPVRMLGRLIGYMLHRKAHFSLVERIGAWIRSEGMRYPCRQYGKMLEDKRGQLLLAAKEISCKLDMEGKNYRIIREEPFVYADDGTKLSVYVMEYVTKAGNISSHVTKVEVPAGCRNS